MGGHKISQTFCIDAIIIMEGFFLANHNLTNGTFLNNYIDILSVCVAAWL